MNMENSRYEKIIDEVVKAHYQKRLINNTHRADYVEAMIALALGESWCLVSRYWDWAPWDLERDDGIRLEIKQSAATQSWSPDAIQTARGKFDIAQRDGYWDYESRWHTGKARYADIYVFAWHPESNPHADHRNPGQWRFFVVPEYKLPIQKSISLNPLKKLAPETSYDDLLQAVDAAVDALPLRTHS